MRMGMLVLVLFMQLVCPRTLLIMTIMVVVRVVVMATVRRI
jgi:hypothetical protein